jgi:5-methylcytosine-specific restriction enzyme A
MKLMNFRRLDPQYTTDGKTGLVRGGKEEEQVWSEFADDPDHCRDVANATVASLDDPEVNWGDADHYDQDVHEVSEGRLLTRQHMYRERDRKLVKAKLKEVEKKYGRLACEVCRFDFRERYGERGNGFIECHHTKPIATAAPLWPRAVQRAQRIRTRPCSHKSSRSD